MTVFLVIDSILLYKFECKTPFMSYYELLCKNVLLYDMWDFCVEITVGFFGSRSLYAECW